MKYVLGWIKPVPRTDFQEKYKDKKSNARQGQVAAALRNNQRLHEEHLNHLCPKPDLGSYFSRQTLRGSRKMLKCIIFHRWLKLKSNTRVKNTLFNYIDFSVTTDAFA